MEKKEITLGGLMDLCCKLNCDDFHVWMDYSGHIDAVQIRIQPGGYKEGAESIYLGGMGVYALYLNDDPQDVQKGLADLKRELLNEYEKYMK